MYYVGTNYIVPKNRIPIIANVYFIIYTNKMQKIIKNYKNLTL